MLHQLEGLLQKIPVVMVILAPDGTVIGGTAGAARAAQVPPEALFEGRIDPRDRPQTAP